MTADSRPPFSECYYAGILSSFLSSYPERETASQVIGHCRLKSVSVKDFLINNDNPSSDENNNKLGILPTLTTPSTS